MAYKVAPSLSRCRDLNIQEVSHVPVIFTQHWVLLSDAVDYLLAKARGLWVTSVVGPVEPLSDYADPIRKCSAKTLEAIGEDLTNFFDWCEARKVEWRSLSYDILVNSYVGDMKTGRWSKRNTGQGLQASTINRRLLYVGDFLLFAAKHGRRESLRIQYSMVRDSRDGTHWYKRLGNVRRHPRDLRVPTPEELTLWLGSLRTKHGLTPYLMAKTVIGLGLRAEEVILMRVDQLPPVPSDSNMRSVEMWIRYGTKGDRDPGDPEKKGKARSIRIPRDLLIELHGYASGHRNLGTSRFRESATKNGSSETVPKELFLSRHTGRPLSYSRFHALWTGAAVPYIGFSPHAGRHTWACYTLSDKMREQALLAANNGPLGGMAAQVAGSLITTYIQPQLGHVDEATSQMYLRWIAETIDLMPALNSWWDALES